jgi:nicotinamide-nucleotide amidase
MDVIRFVLKESLSRAQVVVVSGGLGPTVDDITRDAIAGLLGRDVVSSPEALADLRRKYAGRGRAVTPAAERQALIVEGAETLLNRVGAAPGERLDLPEEKTLFVVPGPPGEFAAVLEDHLVPWLAEQFPDAVPLDLRVLTTQGIGESDIVTRLEAAGLEFDEAIDVGFYPGQGRVEIRLSAPAEKSEALDLAERLLRELLNDCLAG